MMLRPCVLSIKALEQVEKKKKKKKLREGDVNILGNELPRRW